MKSFKTESFIKQPLIAEKQFEKPGEFSGSLSPEKLWDTAILSQAALGFVCAEGATTTFLRLNNNRKQELPAPQMGDDIVCALGKPKEVGGKLTYDNITGK